MKLVYLESPFAGADADEVAENVEYARRCMADSLKRGESPFASHLLYTQDGILDDTIPAERERGIHAGFDWGKHAEASIFYIDRGVSNGMLFGVTMAVRDGRTVVVRSLEFDWTVAHENSEKDLRRAYNGAAEKYRPFHAAPR